MKYRHAKIFDKKSEMDDYIEGFVDRLIEIKASFIKKGYEIETEDNLYKFIIKSQFPEYLYGTKWHSIDNYTEDLTPQEIEIRTKF